MRLLFALSLLVLTVTGCYSYRPSITDLNGARGIDPVGFGCLSPRMTKLEATETNVTFHFLRETSIWQLATVSPEVIQGDVYLNAVYDYHAAGLTNVTLEFGNARYPSDWRKRLYWVEQDSFTSPLNPFQKHFRHIGRRKIEL